MLTVSDNHIVLGGGGGGGGGDVVGAASSTDNAIARFDGVTGKVVQNSAVTIDDTGKMGISVASPAAKLDIKGSGATVATSSLVVKNSSNEELLRIKDNMDIQLANGALSLTESIRSLTITGKNVEGERAYLQLNAGNGARSFFYVQQIGATEDLLLRNYGTNGADSGNIVFQTNGNFMILSSVGNVGIGTLSPTAKLDVDGTSRFRSSATFNGKIIDNVGSSGTDGQVLKKVGGQVIWANP